MVDTADGAVPLLGSEYELTTVVLADQGKDAVDPTAPSIAAAVLPTGGFVVLDLELNDALLAEGYARDIVREVQDARKAAGLEVADRIDLSLSVPGSWQGAVEDHRDLIARETLAVSVTIDLSPTDERSVLVTKAATDLGTAEVSA
ncbi:DUF5915 domain-containing protein [Oerskovia sp. M15]